tara:strand:+ start:297 stop:1049 length:753 start_codon:yes stop_codon:yes gene_type:complete
MPKMSERNIYLSIIIPGYNEEKRLPTALKVLDNYLQKQNYLSEVIIVSDGSTDETKRVAEEFRWSTPRCRVFEYFPNKGKGAAVKLGMLEARGDINLFMDADLSVPVDFIEKCLIEINKGNGVVIGSRALNKSRIIEGQSFLRQTLGKMYGILLNKFTGLGIKDTQCGFKMFTSEATERLFPVLFCVNQLFDAEILLLAKSYNISIVEVPVDWYHDGDTRLSYSFSNSIWVLKELLKLRQRAKVLAEKNE